MLRCLDPKEALANKRKFEALSPLAINFPSIIQEDQFDDLDDEWRKLPNFKSLSTLRELRPPEFWCQLARIEDGLLTSRFPHLSKLMMALLALPHSSASVERIFSLMNNIKTRNTNRLKTDSTCSRILTKQYISRQNSCCYSWVPPKSLVEDVIDGKIYRRCKELSKKEEASLHGQELGGNDDFELE